MLQPLALGMHRAARRDLPRRELEEIIGTLLPKVGGEAADAADFLDEVRERSGLLIEAGLGTYAFSHQTFQEYLCARELVDNEKVRGLLLEEAGDEWWQEVTLLYVGMAEATPIVEALLAAEDDQAGARLLLAGRCVAEAVRLEEAARGRVTRRLEEAFATCTRERFLPTGQVLADIAGEDSVDFFLRLAREDAERREAALWSLGQMGRQPNQALRERVLEQLLAHFQEEELRQGAGVALAHVWGAEMVAELSKRGLPLPLIRHGAEALAVVDDSLLLEALRGTDVETLQEILAEALDKVLVEVPASEFLMGDEKRKVYVDAFQIDKYPVTNVQYKRFLDANPQHPIPFVDKDWARPYNWDQGSRSFPQDRAIHPVVLVSWHDAVAYAKWAGKRLPTEEEWEKAARGTDGREYPWGDWTEGHCNSREAGVGGTTPVGQYSPEGDSPYGCVDTAGNVWEWTASDYDKHNKVLRGRSWFSIGRYVRAASCYDVTPDESGQFLRT